MSDVDGATFRRILFPGLRVDIPAEDLAERFKARMDRLESENQRLGIAAGEIYPPLPPS